MKSLSVLGSTGSIGCSALDVAAALPERFRVAALAAGKSIERLAAQVVRHGPALVSVADRSDAERLRAMLPAGSRARIVYGREGLEEAASLPETDIVVGGLVGALGLRSAYAAAVAGKRLALANKETLVVAGELMMRTARASGAEIVPVDSEHCAIHQALRCGSREEVARLVLTASGGPFRDRDLSSFGAITVEDALAHPTWKMGPKITIDSATMMNKGLEIIEARFLFDLPLEKIDVIVHPQSAVHSFVEYVDGSLIAQLSKNDMKFPILYALTYPDRIPSPFGMLDLAALARLDFQPLDPRRYPAVGLARAALQAGGGMPAVLNAANEVAVDAFLTGKISFLDIVAVVGDTVGAFGSVASPSSVEEAEGIDQAARRKAAELAAAGRAAGIRAAG